MIVKTPSGYEVHLKEYLSFGQKRQLQKFMYSKMRVKQVAGEGGKAKAEIEEFSVDFMQELQDKAFEMLVEKIIIDGKEYTEDLYNMVMGWKEADGQVLYAKIDEATAMFSTPQEEDAAKKK